MPSTSDVARVDDIELQGYIENVGRSTENLIEQLSKESSEDLPMRELLGLDKQLRSIRGSLKVEVSKRFSWKKESRKKSASLRKSETIQNTMMGLTKRIAKLNDDLSVRQESIDLLKIRLTNQITSFKETIAKVLDKDTSLAEKIRTLF